MGSAGGTVALSLLALATAAAVAPGTARAECAMPGSATFPVEDQVPPRPTLYRFELAWGDPAPLQVTGADGPVRFSERDAGSDDRFRIRAITVEAASGTFTIGSDGELPRTYHVTRDWVAAADRPLEVVSVAWRQEAWTCSHTEGLAVQLRAPGVVAFRVRWSDGVTALVPAHDGSFWRAMAGEVDPAEARAFLGHPNCLDYLIPHDHVGRRDFELVALYPDGSERAVDLPRGGDQPTPPAIDTDQPAAPAAPAPLTDPAPAARPDAGWCCGRAWPAVAGGALAIVIVIGLAMRLVIARRRRRGATLP